MRLSVKVRNVVRRQRDCCPHCGSSNFRPEWRPAVRCMRCFRVWLLGDSPLSARVAAILARSEKLAAELELSRPTDQPVGK